MIIDSRVRENWRYCSRSADLVLFNAARGGFEDPSEFFPLRSSFAESVCVIPTEEPSFGGKFCGNMWRFEYGREKNDYVK